MSATRYLITGGAGFIGSHLTRTLLEEGAKVRVLDNFSTGKEANLAGVAGDLEVIRGDLRDLETVRAAVAGMEVVLHQAALPSVPRSIADPLATLQTNINGTQHVLLAARDEGVRRVVYASSSSTYGNTPTLPKHEELPTNPRSLYALHKLTGERLCGLFTQLFGLETVALRYFNVFGPRQDPASTYAAVIPRFLRALLEGERPVVFGDGEQTRDFTYVANVVRANLLAATAPSVAGQVINVGCGERISLNELLRQMGALLGVAARAEYREPRAGDVHDSLADISLAQRLLGYQPSVMLRDGLARTLEAIRASQPRIAHTTLSGAYT